MCELGRQYQWQDPFTNHSPKTPSPSQAILRRLSFKHIPRAPLPVETSCTNGQVPVCPLANKNLQACRSTPRGPDFRVPRPAAYAVPMPTQRSKEPSLQNVLLPIYSQRTPAARPIAVGCIASQHRLETIRAFEGMSGHDFYYQHHQSTGLKRSHDCPAPHQPHILHA